MNLGRIFANAIARRIAYIVVATLFAAFGIARAEAASSIGVCDYGQNCTQPQAFAAISDGAGLCNRWSPGATPTYMTSPYLSGPAQYMAKIKCQPANPNSSSSVFEVYTVFYSSCPSGEVFNQLNGGCQKPCTSVNRPSTTVPRSPLSGSLGCNTGCTVTYRNNGDDTSTVSVTGAMCGPDFKNNCPTGTFWNGMMALCQPFEPTCPAGQVKKEGVCVPEGKCPAGMIAVQGTTPGAVQTGELYCKAEASECPAGTIKAPATGKCIPGEGQCAAGEARRDNGTCGKDANGDGKADEDDDDPSNDPDKDSASGGDSCDSPPSCSGNAIACIQVKIQWRIDCNTRRAANISGGTCDAVPVCTGKKCDAMEYAQLMQQWRATCALEKLAKKESGETGSDGTDANKNGVADALEGRVGTSESETPTVTKFGARFSLSVIKEDNIFGGGSCPEPPSFQLMGQSISGADFPYWCQAMAILRALILIFGAYTAVKILMGWGF